LTRLAQPRHVAADLLQTEGTMRFKRFTLGIAILVILGIWQVQAAQRSEVQRSPARDASDLLKHGEYLVSHVALCGDCHTPRKSNGDLDQSRLLQGTTLDIVPKQKTEHWADESPDITGSGLARKWSLDEMVKFFTTGVDPQGMKATPPMPAFRLEQSDARAVVLYLKSLPGKEGSGERAKKSKNPD
jgi:mono/diheme cytochrome c family protein